MPYATDMGRIYEAADRIGGKAHRTPIWTCATLDALAGRSLFFKCELFQKVGAFKFRGAYNAVAKLDEATAARGVVTHSSGNHAQALALAAKIRGIPAHIVMPDTSNPIKVRAVEGYGARVVMCKPTLRAREVTAEWVLEETGGTLIHPYNHPDVIAGQGTAAMELLMEVPELDAVIAPIGGGGLMAGTCLAARGLRGKRFKVFGAEPQGADDAARSLAAGELLPQTDPKTMADGLLTSLGDLTWPILRDHLNKVWTVSEDEIADAMRLLWERAKLMAEPSSAVALAAVLQPAFRAMPRLGKVGIILSGGNVDVTRLPWGAS